jgi:hypothetical protein
MNIGMLNKVSEQVRQCQEEYGSYASQWGFMCVLAEENEELFIELRKKSPNVDRVKAEMIDI